MLFAFWGLIVSALIIRKPNFYPALIIFFLVKINYNAPNVADFSNYSNIYNNITERDLYQTGYGWYVLNNIGRNLGLDYNHYKAWSIIVCTLCIWCVSRYLLGESSNMLAGLYLLYPALIDTIQIRFYTAMTIVLIGIVFLAQQKMWSTITYIGIVLLASTIHTSALFYLTFAIYPIIEKHVNKLKYILVVISIFFIVFRNQLYGFITMFSNERQMQYFDSGSGVTSGSGWLLPIAILSIIIMYLVDNQLYQLISTNLNFSEIDRRNASTIRGISLMMFLLIPLVILSGELYRVFRIIFILSYISIGIIAKRGVPISLGHIKFGNRLINISPEFLGGAIAFIAFAINILYLTPAAFDSYF